MKGRKRGLTMMAATKCRVDDCNTPAKARGLCMKHYARVRRTGDPTPKDPSGWTAAANGDALRRENERLRWQVDALRIALRDAQAQAAIKPTHEPKEGTRDPAPPASRRGPRRSGSG